MGEIAGGEVTEGGAAVGVGDVGRAAGAMTGGGLAEGDGKRVAGDDDPGVGGGLLDPRVGQGVDVGEGNFG